MATITHFSAVNEIGATCGTMPRTLDLSTTSKWEQVNCKRCLKVQGYHARVEQVTGKPASTVVTVDSVKVAEVRKIDIAEESTEDMLARIGATLERCETCGYQIGSRGHNNSH